MRRAGAQRDGQRREAGAPARPSCAPAAASASTRRARRAPAGAASPARICIVAVAGRPAPPAARRRGAARRAGRGEIELASWFCDRTDRRHHRHQRQSRRSPRSSASARGADGRPTFVGGNLGTPLADAVGTAAAAREAATCVVEVSSFQLERVQTLPSAGRGAAQRHRRSPRSLRVLRGVRRGQGAHLRRADRRRRRGGAGGDVAVRVAGARRTGARASPFGGSARASVVRDGDALVDREPRASRYPPSLAPDPRPPQPETPGRPARRAAAGAPPATIAGALGSFRACRTAWSSSREHDGVATTTTRRRTNVGAAVAALDGRRPRRVGADRGRPRQGWRVRAAGRAAWRRRTRGRAHRRGRPMIAPRSRAWCRSRARTRHGRCGPSRAALAEPGDAVLLAPACSSFDMFRDYAHRGDVFRARAGARGGGRVSGTRGQRSRGSRRARPRRSAACVVARSCGFGVVMVYSASAVFASSELRRLDLLPGASGRVSRSLGLVAMVVLARIDYHRLRALTTRCSPGALGLLVCVTALGRKVGGAVALDPASGRVDIQPAELAKLALHLLAVVLARPRRPTRSAPSRSGFLPHVADRRRRSWCCCLKQPDFGSAVDHRSAHVRAAVRGRRARRATSLGVGDARAPIVYSRWSSAPTYRMRRIMAFLDPSSTAATSATRSPSR